jgi:hypothetical protein
VNAVKTHSLTLNNGAIHHLAQFLATPGALTDAADLFRAGQLLEEQLAELPTPEEIPAGTEHFEAVKLVRSWQRLGENIVEVTERQRETCKKAANEIIKKGIGAGPGVNCLLKQLGLAPEDG